MRKVFFVLIVAIIGGSIFYSARGAGDFLAKILRDGSYILNLINKENSVERYAPADLVELSSLGATGQYIRQEVYEPLSEMMHAAEAVAAPLKIASAYRSYERQEQVLGYWSRRDPNANMYSAKQGHSEHQLGTTIDFAMGDRAYDLREGFGETAQGKWLAENSWEYGFALSYPKNKEDITGYIYEPWHYRYIGKAAAKEWHESGVTLAEFLAAKPQYYRLIRRHDDYKVYSVDHDGTKHWITTAEKFLEMGYDWNDVMIIDRPEFNLYSEGSRI